MEINQNFSGEYQPYGAPLAPKKWHQKSWGKLIILMIILFLIIIGLLVWGIFSIIKNADSGGGLTNLAAGNTDQLTNLAESSNVKSPARQLAEKTDRPTLGNPDASLVIVEFSDFLCPFCTKEFPIIREFVKRHEKDLFYIYRQYPVIDETSMIYSIASLCAREQDKFWPFHDQLFMAKDKKVSDLPYLALRSGLDVEKFNACLNAEKYKGEVVEDAQDGQALGVDGTPTFFVNGARLPGVVSLKTWEEIMGKWEEINK